MYCDLDLEGKNPTNVHDIPGHGDAPSILSLVAYSLVVQKLSSDQMTDGQTENTDNLIQIYPPRP